MKGEQRKDSTVRVDRGDAGSRNTVVGAAEGKNLRALRRMDVELPALVKALSYIAYFKDAQGCYLAVNREYERRSGFKPGEMIGKTAEELFPQDVAEDIRKRDEETLRRGKPIRFERPKIYPSGETKIIETIKAPLYDSDGKIVGIVGVGQDITDRKRMKEELANERDLLRTRIDYIPDAVYFKDVQGRYFLVNRSFLNRPFLG
ncbi:MAG: PAS domain-containing protein, partial [Candidatus Bathyarchaeota archaeon]|nr:PAS domain-containing protein [Candidatus Bathyarchaeota archaeon]